MKDTGGPLAQKPHSRTEKNGWILHAVYSMDGCIRLSDLFIFAFQ